MTIKKIDNCWEISGKDNVAFVGTDFYTVLKAASAYFWGRK
jgi:hypothetical protein